MFVVLLRLSTNRTMASAHMPGHQDWIRRGVKDGVFLLVGNIEPGRGGALLAAGISLEELQARVVADPFVAHNVVAAEIIQITPNLTDSRLAFLQELDE